MTIDEFVDIGRIRSKMDVYKRRKAKAIGIAAEQLESAKNPYLALSGGKDSVAMAFIVNDAARIARKTFRLWTHLSDASFPGTQDTCQQVSDKIGMPIDFYRHDESAFDLMQNKQRQAFGKSGVFFNSIREYAKDKDVAFVGVRAAESKRRKRSAEIHGQVFKSESMGDVTVCHPILWFELMDVAAALWEYEAPIHPIYQKMQVGTNGRKQEEDFIRLGYITSKDLLNKGTAVFLKYNYPAEYARLAEAWPEIRRFV